MHWASSELFLLRYKVLLSTCTEGKMVSTWFSRLIVGRKNQETPHHMLIEQGETLEII
jgi:hypothetical protein